MAGAGDLRDRPDSSDPVGPGAARSSNNGISRIRSARPAEAGPLSELALRSKAHWGYDDAFLDACRAELEVQRDDIAQHDVNLIETSGGVCGFYLLRAIDPSPDAGEADVALSAAAHGAAVDQRGDANGADAALELFYVDPAAIGVGHGRRLWRHMVVSARRGGYKRVSIHSDPHAEGFYRAMGARRIGEVASGSIEGRRLPLMLVDLCGGDELR